MRNLRIFESPQRARRKLAALGFTCLAVAGVGAALLGTSSAASPITVNDDTTGPGPVGATCATPDETSIQDAVTAASPGDTILVCAGTYNEAVDIPKTLTINGAQAGVDARSGRGAVSNESVWTNSCGPVRIMADNVIIDGFTVEGSTDPDPCFLAGIWTNPGFSGTQGGHKIRNNIVQNNISGLELDNTGTFQTQVTQNLFRNNNNPGPGSGNAIQVNFGLNNALVDSNKSQGHTNSSFLVFGGSSGITFSGNELAGGTPERVVWFGVSDSTISGNTSNGSTATNGTVRLAGGNSGIVVSGNTLENGMRGVRVDDPFAVGPNSDVVVSDDNNISGNTIAGLEVDAGAHPGSLDATCNWWGDASGPSGTGPGSGDAIVDPDGVVVFQPWLTAPAPGGACDGPLPQQMERKEAVRDSLATKQLTADKHDAHEIKEAIKHINKSLDPSLWVDANHLDPKKGHKVFDEERAAVGHLEKVKNTDVTPEMDEIVDIDHDLAQTAIDEIPPATNPSRQDKVDKEEAKANEDLAKGDAAAAQGDRKKAIEQYKKAWEHAQHATAEANKA